MTTAIIYWSGTGNTEAMANAIDKGLKEGGNDTAILEIDNLDAGIIDNYEKFAFGCPSMGEEELEETIVEPFFASIEGKLSGKKVALFGSYGWGDGEWMQAWIERCKKAGANVYGEGLIMQEAHDEAECENYGKAYAEF